MRTILAATAALALVACVQDVGAGKTAAEVSEVPTTAAAPAQAAARVLKVDPARSKLGVVGAKITAKHPIVFHDYEGEVGLSESGEVVSVSFVAQVGSIESDNARLTTHLKKEDFLFVDRYPTATFASVAIAPSTDGRGTHSVTGDLAIRGKTKRITFPAAIAVQGDTVQASTEFVIDRRDFDVVYPGKPDDLVQDNVLMQIAFVANQTEA